jgi:hypothetical protein
MKECTTTRSALDRFWVVTNPTPESEIGDILFETDVRGFILQVRGGLDEDRRPRIFADRESAEADALARLAVVRGLSAIAGGVVRGDVRNAARLTLLDDAGEVLFETKIERLPR